MCQIFGAFDSAVRGFQTSPTINRTVPTTKSPVKASENPLIVRIVAPRTKMMHPIEINLSFIPRIFRTLLPTFLAQGLLPSCKDLLSLECSPANKEYADVDHQNDAAEDE
jgi:hypothetical protein